MPFLIIIILIQLVLWGVVLMETNPKYKTKNSMHNVNDLAFRSKGHAIAWLIICLIPFLPVVIFAVRKIREL